MLWSGRGVFACEMIQAGSFLCQYAGILVLATEGERLEEMSPSTFRYFFSHKGKEYWFVYMHCIW